MEEDPQAVDMPVNIPIDWDDFPEGEEPVEWEEWEDEEEEENQAVENPTEDQGFGEGDCDFFTQRYHI